MNAARARRTHLPKQAVWRRVLRTRQGVRRFVNNPSTKNVRAALGGFLVFLFNLALLYYFYVPPSPREQSWLVGVSRIDITPTETVWLSGFASRNRTAESVHPLSKLYVRALAIRHRTNASEAYVVVSIDIVGIDRHLSDRIYAAAKGKFGISRVQLRLCVTHTHSGPVVGDNLAPLVPEDGAERAKIIRYQEFLFGKVLRAVDESLAQTTSASAHFMRGRALLAVNRRQITENQFDGVHRGVTEDAVPALWFTNGEKIVAGIFGYAAHATVLTGGYRYSGDFAGAASQKLERDGGVWLFLASCGGDQNIYPRGTGELVDRYATILSETVRKLLKSKNQYADVSGSISGRHSFVRLPFAKRYTAVELRKRARSKDLVTRRGADRLLEGIGPDGLTAQDYRYGLAVWRIADIRIGFLGGEPTVGYCRALGQIGVAWVVGYCEEVMGYVGTHEVVVSGGREGGERSAWYYGLPAAWREDVEAIVVAGMRGLVVEQHQA